MPIMWLNVQTFRTRITFYPLQCVQSHVLLYCLDQKSNVARISAKMELSTNGFLINIQNTSIWIYTRKWLSFVTFHIGHGSQYVLTNALLCEDEYVIYALRCEDGYIIVGLSVQESLQAILPFMWESWYNRSDLRIFGYHCLLS